MFKTLLVTVMHGEKYFLKDDKTITNHSRSKGT